jgi:hypothetical protein
VRKTQGRSRKQRSRSSPEEISSSSGASVLRSKQTGDSIQQGAINTQKHAASPDGNTLVLTSSLARLPRFRTSLDVHPRIWGAYSHMAEVMYVLYIHAPVLQASPSSQTQVHQTFAFSKALAPNLRVFRSHPNYDETPSSLSTMCIHTTDFLTIDARGPVAMED